MRSKILKKLGLLSECSSGNATMLVALGAPMLIGGAGSGVDLAQWYMWKRELQFAVDQAALAGAWARASSDLTVRGTYESRAIQEYDANVSLVAEFDSGVTAADVDLANYGTGGVNNSVIVRASATRKLPFSALLTDGETTVNVRAQAVFTGGVSFSACMLALNQTAQNAFVMGNSVNGSSACGAGTLSNNSTLAMQETGNSNVPLGTLVSEGEIDDNFSNNGTIYENQENLSNPYEEIDPPSSSGQPTRTYPSTCPIAQPESYTYTADGKTKTHYTFKYYKGANSNNWTLQTSYSGSGYMADYWGGWVNFTNKSVTDTTSAGLQTETTAAEGVAVDLGGNGSNTYWRVPYTSTQDDITTIYGHYTPASDGKVYLQPGVYSSISIACEAVFAPGIYFVSGDLDFGQNLAVTGTGGVMFVLENAGAIHINSNSNVTLSGISGTMLTSTYGMDQDEAAKLAGMLIWDPQSTANITVNGNANLHLSGVLYMPNRDATFNGNGLGGSSSGNCMMVAADTIQITGNFSLNNFCVSTGGSAMSIGGNTTSVKLVA